MRINHASIRQTQIYRVLMESGEMGESAGIEWCGVITATQSGQLQKLFPTNNVAGDPSSDFGIDAGDVHNLERHVLRYNLEKIVGIWHTHTKSGLAYPSQDDWHGLPPNHIGLMYHNTSGYAWWYTGSDTILGFARLRGPVGRLIVPSERGRLQGRPHARSS